MSKFEGPQTAALICQVRAIAEYGADPQNRGVILGPLAGELFVAGQEILDEDERRHNEWKKLAPTEVSSPSTDDGDAA